MILIWDGRGEIPAGAAYYTTRDGTLRGREYVYERAMTYLARRAATFSLRERKRAVSETVYNDAWMKERNGMLVEAICRDVDKYLWRVGNLS